MDAEANLLLKQYEESGDAEVADRLIELLNAARRERWIEATSSLDFTSSSRKAGL